MSKEINLRNKEIWNANAASWDKAMDHGGNRWHAELIAPPTIELLGMQPNDKLLDIGCGNGVFARKMAAKGIDIVAFDFSENNIKHAKTYASDRIVYKVLDATQYAEMIQLGENSFDAAVANMVIMDIPEIEPMFKALAKLLKNQGVFVFSISHPCFQSSEFSIIEERFTHNGREVMQTGVKVTAYAEPLTTMGEAIVGQPEIQYYFHRPLNHLMKMGFKHGFVVDGFEEPIFEDKPDKWYGKIPPVVIIRMRKTG